MKVPRFFFGLFLGLVLGGGGVLFVERFISITQPHSLPSTPSSPSAHGIRRYTERSPSETNGLAKLVQAGERREQAIGHDQGPQTEEAKVIQVIDGDTFVVKGEKTVRILGIDTPERYKPYYDEARDFLKEEILGKGIRLSSCAQEPLDRYGRVLAFAEVQGKDVGTELLRKGLARTLFVGPCSEERGASYLYLERNAFRQARGIWADQEPRRVDHEQAAQYIGWMMTVTGQVRRVHMGPRAVHLNFGKDHRTDFTVVIFRTDLPTLSKQGLLMPVTDYKGKDVQVTGYLKSYQGPEIIIDSADQIKVVN